MSPGRPAAALKGASRCFTSQLPSCVSLVCRVLYEGKEQVKQGWYVIETTPYSRSASLSSGGGPAAHRVFLTYRRALDTQGLHTLGITDIGLLLPSKGEVAPHTFCRVDKNLNTGMVSLRRRGLFPRHKSSSAGTHFC